MKRLLILAALCFFVLSTPSVSASYTVWVRALNDVDASDISGVQIELGFINGTHIDTKVTNSSGYTDPFILEGTFLNPIYYSYESSKTGYITNPNETFKVWGFDMVSNTWLVPEEASVILWVVPQNFAQNQSVQFVVETNAHCPVCNLIVYGFHDGSSLPSYIALKNEITFPYEYSTAGSFFNAGSWEFQANVTDGFLIVRDSDPVASTVYGAIVVEEGQYYNETQEPIPMINATEWQQAGFGWALPFFSPMFISTIVMALLAAVSARIGGFTVGGIVALAMIFIYSIFGIYPVYVGITLIIIGAFIIAKWGSTMVGGGGGGGGG